MTEVKQHDAVAAKPRQIVYVRQARPSELPPEIAETDVYSIHDEAGNRLGLAPGRELAFLAALQHEMTPHSVH
ncbi:MAG: DUF1150 family protein [Paracoccaceae bacterium]